VITESFDDRYAVLPRVVGEGAAGAIGDYMALIEPFPAIARRARAGVWCPASAGPSSSKAACRSCCRKADPERALPLVAGSTATSRCCRARSPHRPRMPGSSHRPADRGGARRAQGALKEREKSGAAEGRAPEPLRQPRSGGVDGVAGAPIVSVLDIGSTKICCLVGRLRAPPARRCPGRTHAVEVLGVGHQRSRGIKSGVVVDLDAAEEAVRKTVDAAERMAGLTIDSLIVTLSAGRLASETFAASVALAGKPVAEGRHRPRACRRAALFGHRRAAPSSTPCRSAIPSTARAASPTRAA
jgi:hypothetical protein